MNKAQEPIRSILVIDDDRDDFELVSEAVSSINEEISVSFISRCDQVANYRDHKFDLILLDINMPLHDGFYWLKAIRSQGYKELPIVMFTNSLSPEHIQKSYKEGANLYYSKPHSFRGLVNGLKKLFQLNWSDPIGITTMYSNNGKYATFQVD